ncbi:DUF397 domain-containing protein [Streptomyces yatensis]|uniref:DUF397 domain-containing protein n=1 Tax=Streptomyces yatensis TaxID=155177 RepID=A0ABN2IST8_9ACTN
MRGRDVELEPDRFSGAVGRWRFVNGHRAALHAKWRKSSFSTDAANCVELAAAPDGIRIRESDEPDAALRTSPAVLGALIRAVKAGRLDRSL